MQKKLLSLFLFSLLFFSQGLAGECMVPTYTLEIVANYEGDKHGEFRGDLVAVLNDGSCWKVHPKDRTLFSQWVQHDVIQVCKRMTSYWFKREHKFELYNHSTGERVRAMLVQYPTYPTLIQDSQTILVDTIIKTNSWVDAWGFIHRDSYKVNVYNKLLFLSDGTLWTIKDEGAFACFCKGDRVYVGYNTNDYTASDRKISPFMISGIEREAHWAWVY